MKAAAFEYHRPRNITQALSLLREFGEEGKILAGGQSLMPLMNFRLARPAHLIDINFIKGLDRIRRDQGTIKVGCLARQSRLLSDPVIKEACPLVADAAACIGYEQTRNRGTLCGSLAHADPAAELPAVLLALDGFVTVGNVTAKRDVAAGEFFQSYLTTALAGDEMVLEASIPEIPPGAGWSFMEYARRFGDFAIVGVAVVLATERDRIAGASIALTGVGETPWRERQIEALLVGEKGSEDLFAKIAGEIAATIRPASDIHASSAYRKSLARFLSARALTEAWGRARSEN